MVNLALPLILSLASADLHVGYDQPYPTLTAAVAAAQANDSITIHPGEYREAVKLRVPLKIRGEGSVLISGTQLALIGTGSVPRALIEVEATADGTLIEGLSFAHATTGTSVQNAAGVRLISASAWIRNCTFTDCDNGLFASGDVREVKLEHSRFYDNGRQGTSHSIYISGGEFFSAYDCEMIGTIAGQNVKVRARKSTIVRCKIGDSKNREIEILDRENDEPGESLIADSLIFKRWCAENDHDQWVYAPDQSRRPANLAVLQFGDDRTNIDTTYRGTIYLLRNKIVTPYAQPVCQITALGVRLYAMDNEMVRPEGTTGQGQTQRFVTLGMEAQVYGRGNKFPPTFVDAALYSMAP